MQRLNISTKTLKFLLALILLRLFLPFEFYDSIDIKSRKIYPFLNKVGRINLFESTISLSEFLLIVWITGFLVLLLIDIIKTLKFSFELKKLENHLTDEEFLLYLDLTEKLRIKNPPRLVKSGSIKCPFTIGVLRSEIYIGDRIYCNDNLIHILVHELIHYKSFDNFKKIILMVLSRFFWWNPFIGILVKDITQLIEIECDRKVLTYLPDREDYINAIIGQIENSLLIYKQEKLGVSYFSPSKSENIKQRLGLIEEEKHSQGYNRKLIALSMVLFISSYLFILIPFNLPAGISHEAGFMKITKEERENYVQDEFNLKRDFFEKYICEVK